MLVHVEPHWLRKGRGEGKAKDTKGTSKFLLIRTMPISVNLLHNFIDK